MHRNPFIIYLKLNFGVVLFWHVVVVQTMAFFVDSSSPFFFFFFFLSSFFLGRRDRAVLVDGVKLQVTYTYSFFLPLREMVTSVRSGEK